MSRYYSDDPVADEARYTADREKEMQENSPQCCECDRYITEGDYYEFNGDYICEDCLNNYHKKTIW
jgi:formylmethanofuran dehydrogenase subunit E